MTENDLKFMYEWQNKQRELLFHSGNLNVSTGYDGESGDIDLTYASALNLASKLLQWATNLPESEKGNIHKIDGEWVDVDDLSTE